jgi:hypothetical protein
MALIKGKQIQGTSVSLDKLDGTGAVTLTGSITAPAASILISSAPTSDSHAANKAYVDSVATGLDVKSSVVAIYRENTVNGLTPVNTAGGAALDSATLHNNVAGNLDFNAPVIFDGVTLQDGDRVLIAIATASSRQKINGIWIYEANRFRRAADADNLTPNTGEVSGGLFTFVEQGTVYGDTGWVLTSPNGVISQLFDPLVPATSGYTTQLVFTQFSYAGVVEAGAGLARTGTVFNLSYDTSIFQISGGNLLQIRNGAISNTLLTNSTTSFSGDTGTASIALGQTLSIVGHPNGIDTAVSGSTMTITLDLSELATVTTIADTDFIVSSKSSDSTNQKITFANLKSLIGATSQLGISVEGGSAASFDLDTDTLDFSAGDGLTFTKSASTAGTTDTLTVTLNLNAITEDVFTSFTVAANGTFTKTLSFATTQIVHIMINGVTLKSSQYSVSGTTLTIPANAIPYAIEASDELSVRYIKQA